MRKKVIFFIGILLLCVAVYGIYLYQKPHTSVAAITPAFTIKATELYTAYSQNEAEANSKFLDKVVLVQGTVGEVLRTDSTLTILLQSNDIAGGVSCNVATGTTAAEEIKNGESISIKGRCTGFLADVTLADCVIEQ